MNQAVRPNPIARFFIGLWNVMNFTRRLILNLVFFGLLFVFLAVMAAVMASGGGNAKPLHERTTLVIAPEGKLVEQFSTDPLTRALAKSMGDKGGEVQLRDLLRAIDAARDDKKIERVFLDVDKLQASGFASMREVAAALARLRVGQAGGGLRREPGPEPVPAGRAGQRGLPRPDGQPAARRPGSLPPVFPPGPAGKARRGRAPVRVGEYKSAAEPYILDAASKDAKEADLFWMNDVWQRYLSDIAAARKLDAEQLAAGIDALPDGIAATGGDIAKLALQQKLVDGLKTEEDVDDLLTQRGVADKDADGGFRQVSLDDYLAQLDARRNPLDERAQVAVVVAEARSPVANSRPAR
jgi:protease-4